MPGDRRRLGQGHPALTGCGTGAGSPSSSSPSCCPSRIRASSTRIAWAGSWRPARRRTCCSGTRRSRRPAGGDRGDPGQGDLPGAVHPRPGGPLPAVGTRRTGGRRRPGGELLLLDGAGHLPQAREPVVVNRADPGLRRPLPALRRGRVGPARLDQAAEPAQASCSTCPRPIGLGHVRRDLAIADELRKLRPDLEVHWLAQHPVTELLRERSELIHPASAFLASESGAHRDRGGRARPARLRGGQVAWTRSWSTTSWSSPTCPRSEPYDLWVGDEAWDLDYFLHENPELKRRRTSG